MELKTVQEYGAHLRSLLPRGAAWPRDIGAKLFELLDAFAVEFTAVHNAALGLLEEADPRTTSLMLSDWERVFGLPECGPIEQTTAERRDALVEKVTRRGGQSPQDIIDAADRVGFDVTVTEFDPMTCIDPCNHAINQGGWRYAFQVSGPEETIRLMNCRSACNEPLRSWGNELLECVVESMKPAHTFAVFSYGAS